MKKLIFLISFSLLFVFTKAGYTQQLTGQLLMPSVMPSSISEWQMNPALVRLQLMNNSDSAIEVRCSGTLRDLRRNATVAYIDDNDQRMPLLQIPARGQITFFGRDVINSAAIHIENYYSTVVGTTGRIPEGNYEHCVRITDNYGHVLLLIGRSCCEFTVNIAEPVTLLTPRNGEVISPVLLPLFRWTPVSIPGQLAKYILTVKPLFEGQSHQDAMDRNPVLFTTTVMSAFYQYLASDPLFSLYQDAQGFVWRVRAVDNYGRPLTTSEGWSNIGGFICIYTYFPKDDGCDCDKIYISEPKPRQAVKVDAIILKKYTHEDARGPDPTNPRYSGPTQVTRGISINVYNYATLVCLLAAVPDECQGRVEIAIETEKIKTKNAGKISKFEPAYDLKSECTNPKGYTQSMEAGVTFYNTYYATESGWADGPQPEIEGTIVFTYTVICRKTEKFYLTVEIKDSKIESSKWETEEERKKK